VYLKWFQTETRVFIGDSDDEIEFERQNEGVERGVLIRKFDFGLPKMAKQWLARMMLPPPKSTTTLAQLYEDPLLIMHSYIVMTIILRQSLTLQAGNRETRYFSSTL